MIWGKLSYFDKIRIDLDSFANMWQAEVHLMQLIQSTISENLVNDHPFVPEYAPFLDRQL